MQIFLLNHLPTIFLLQLVIVKSNIKPCLKPSNQETTLSRTRLGKLEKQGTVTEYGHIVEKYNDVKTRWLGFIHAWVMRQEFTEQHTHDTNWTQETGANTYQVIWCTEQKLKKSARIDKGCGWMVCIHSL